MPAGEVEYEEFRGISMNNKRRASGPTATAGLERSRCSESLTRRWPRVLLGADA